MVSTISIPKDLPQSNPLLFSFLMILDALKINILINGKYQAVRPLDKIKILPAFEYAVNNWSVTALTDSDNETQPNGFYSQQMEVRAALWTEQPPSDCKIVWSKFPSGNDVKEKPFNMDYLYGFEQWRIETFSTLELILRTLSQRGQMYSSGSDSQYLADIFGWEIVGNKIDYTYALDATSNKYYGVGAIFNLKGAYWNCCPRPDFSLLNQDYINSQGFEIDWI